jgi:hypothetical protein
MKYEKKKKNWGDIEFFLNCGANDNLTRRKKTISTPTPNNKQKYARIKTTIINKITLMAVTS